MKITKYVHACVVFEDDDHVALFDPGDFTLASGLLNVGTFSKLDFVIITHEHSDHYNEPIIKKVIAKFPDVRFYTNDHVAVMLEKIGVKNIETKSDSIVTMKPLDHQSMAPLAPLPMCENIEVHYKSLISHPGDSHHMQTSHEILFVPVAGPWGATIDAVRMADRLKPKYIMPIHDWMWNEQWRASMYARIKDYFAKQDIQVLEPTDGQTIELGR